MFEQFFFVCNQQEMWNFINTEIVNITERQNITHTMVTHNNESVLTIVVPRQAFAEISFRRKN